MDEQQKIARAAVSGRLEQSSLELAQTAKDIEAGLEERYYIPLAEEASKHTSDSARLEDAKNEIDSLHRAAHSILQSYQTVSAMEDELKARTHDARRSQKHKKLQALNPPANGSIDLEEERKDHFARGMNLYKLLLLLAVGSFAGVIVEMLWCYLTRGSLESRRGLVYGPFNLLYGAGAVFLTLTLYKFRNRGYIWSFLGGFVVGSLLEYLCSWGQEVLLGSRSWDYSDMPLNINGRICLAYSVFWGVLGVLWIKDIYPRAAKLILKIPNRAGRIVTCVITAFLIVDACVTAVALARWSSRIDGKPASNGFWEFVDERFPDSRMERIFANMEFGEASPTEEGQNYEQN